MRRSQFLALSIIACLAILSGCAASSREPAEPQAQHSGLGDDGAGCHSERPVGSNISREVCRTPQEVENSREEARNLMTPGRLSPPDPNGRRRRTIVGP